MDTADIANVILFYEKSKNLFDFRKCFPFLKFIIETLFCFLFLRFCNGNNENKKYYYTWQLMGQISISVDR